LLSTICRKTASVRIPIERAPSSIQIDPDGTLLKEIVDKR
jgi:hypothetical protein